MMRATQTQQLTRHVYTNTHTNSQKQIHTQPQIDTQPQPHTRTHTQPVMPCPPPSLLCVHFLIQHLQGLGHVEPHIGHLVIRHCYHSREYGLAYCFSIHRISDNLDQGLRRGKVSLTVRKLSILLNVEDYSKVEFYIYTTYGGVTCGDVCAHA